jgi:hypothetical protein
VRATQIGQAVQHLVELIFAVAELRLDVAAGSLSFRGARGLARGIGEDGCQPTGLPEPVSQLGQCGCAVVRVPHIQPVIDAQYWSLGKRHGGRVHDIDEDRAGILGSQARFALDRHFYLATAPIRR